MEKQNMPAVMELPEETFAMQLANAQSVEGSMWTNYVMETEDDKIKFFSAITQPDKKLSEVINVPFNLTAVYCDTAKHMTIRQARKKYSRVASCLMTKAKAMQQEVFAFLETYRNSLVLLDILQKRNRLR